MPVDGNAKTPKLAPSGSVDASNIDAKRQNAAASQSGEGDSRSAASVPPPASSEAHTPGNEDRRASAEAPRSAANGTEHRRYRGRRRLRERKQVRARFDELCSKLERKEIDPKVAAIQVQCLNGVLSCLNSEHDEDFGKRLAALEAKQGGPKKRGGDA